MKCVQVAATRVVYAINEAYSQRWFYFTMHQKKVGLQTPIKLPDHIGYSRNIKLR